MEEEYIYIVKKIIEEAINIVRKENYELEEWYASSERPEKISVFNANQRNIKTRNQIILKLQKLSEVICADNNAQIEIRREIEQRWFWINNIFWWVMGLITGLIISGFYPS